MSVQKYEKISLQIHNYRDIFVLAKEAVKSFLTFYNGIFTKSALERLTGINQKQLWHYAKGTSVPRRKQVQKIEDALHRLGRELNSLSF